MLFDSASLLEGRSQPTPANESSRADPTATPPDMLAFTRASRTRLTGLTRLRPVHVSGAPESHFASPKLSKLEAHLEDMPNYVRWKISTRHTNQILWDDPWRRLVQPRRE